MKIYVLSFSFSNVLHMFRYAANHTAVATITASRSATKGIVGHVPAVGCAHVHVAKLLIRFPALKIYPVVETHVGKS